MSSLAQHVRYPKESSGHKPRDISAAVGFGDSNWLITLFVLTITGLTALGVGQIVRYLYPLAAVGISFYLYKRAPVAYLKFVLWLYFLSSFVRRVVDFRAGWADSNPILAAPILASLVCFPALFGDRTIWRRRTTLPFIIAFLCVAHGFCVGFFFVPKGSLIVATMNWAAPLVFGFFLYREFAGDQTAAYKESLVRAFTWGLLAIGAYGITQFCIAPAWDVYWLNQIEVSTFGIPEPFGIRVFSTMNSPVPFAVALFVGLLLLMQQKTTLLIVLASLLGYLSLLLSSVRAAWLAWAFGAALVAFRQRNNLRRPIIGALILSVCIAASMLIGPVRDVVADRFRTLTSPGDDQSFQSRNEGYAQVLSFISAVPFGFGLGSMDAKFSGKADLGPHLDTEIGARDSGLLDILFSLGWFAGAAYLFALALLGCLLGRLSFTRTTFEGVAAIIGLAAMTQLFLGSVTVGFPGVMLWGFAGISLSSGALRAGGRI